MRLSDGRVGLAICALGAALVAASAADADGSRPGPVLGLIAAVAAAGVAGWLAARVAPWLTPAVAVAVTAASVVPFLAEVGEADAAPLGYANADGTLFVVGALTALALTLSTAAPVAVRVVGGMATVWLAAAALAAASTAAVALLVSVAGVAVVAATRPAVAALFAGLGLAALCGLTILVAAAGRGDVDEGGDLSVRAALWHEAYVLAVEHPLTGVGPGRFDDASDATDDPDLRWAHHGPLQAAAELGLGGALLLAAAVAWALGRAALATGVPATAAVATVTAVTAHACFDYVLHEPALAVVAAALVGAARPNVG